MEQAVHPERFDPRDQQGTLIDTEHRGRYWWASRAVAGKDVLDAGCGTGYGMGLLAEGGAASVKGVDIDAEAVAEAGTRFGDPEAVVQGDLMELPLPDASFDVVVCFEAIEHVADGRQAIGELRRVLRPGGLLLVSSPNPDVYPAGNEHHVHEYRPDELAATAHELFANVGAYRQHPWLATRIEPVADADANGAGGDAGQPELRSTTSLETHGEMYAVVAASDAPLPPLGGLVALGSAFELQWWSNHVASVEREAHRAVAQAMAREQAVSQRLEQANAALLEAQQELAKVPVLEHRLQEQIEDTNHQHAKVAALEGSITWRITAPLRRLLRRFKR
jgi:ubiquinone/menaquinone biosynthesis C-methylase UbiE